SLPFAQKAPRPFLPAPVPLESDLCERADTPVTTLNGSRTVAHALQYIPARHVNGQFQPQTSQGPRNSLCALETKPLYVCRCHVPSSYVLLGAHLRVVPHARDGGWHSARHWGSFAAVAGQAQGQEHSSVQ